MNQILKHLLSIVACQFILSVKKTDMPLNPLGTPSVDAISRSYVKLFKIETRLICKRGATLCRKLNKYLLLRFSAQ